MNRHSSLVAAAVTVIAATLGWTAAASPAFAGTRTIEPCTEAHVSVDVSEPQAAMGHREITVTLTNTATDPSALCWLGQAPQRVTADSSTKFPAPSHSRTGGTYFTPDVSAQDVVLRPGESAVTHVGWSTGAASASGNEIVITLNDHTVLHTGIRSSDYRPSSFVATHYSKKQTNKGAR